jgi:hypothetical protein
MPFRNAIVLSAAAILAACAVDVAKPVDTVWLRTDGQSGRNNPALVTQYEADKAACERPAAQGAEPGVDKDCMLERGYIQVPADQAEQKAAELRARAPAQPQPAPRPPRQ